MILRYIVCILKIDLYVPHIHYRIIFTLYQLPDVGAYIGICIDNSAAPYDNKEFVAVRGCPIIYAYTYEYLSCSPWSYNGSDTTPT